MGNISVNGLNGIAFFQWFNVSMEDSTCNLKDIVHRNSGTKEQKLWGL